MDGTSLSTHELVSPDAAVQTQFFCSVQSHMHWLQSLVICRALHHELGLEEPTTFP